MKPKNKQLFHSLTELASATIMIYSQGISAMTTGVADTLTTLATNQTLSNHPLPNFGDGNGDGILDVQQTNIVTLPDQVLGNYITLEVNPECVIVESYTDLAEFQPISDDTHWYPQGLLYFDLQCQQAQVTLYFHGIQKLLPQMEFRKYGTSIPGDFNTLGWYTLPNVTFHQVQIGDQPVITASYVLTDGQPGDLTGVDGHIVDPTGMGVDTDFDNVIGLLAKSYEASILEGTATITVTRTGLVGALTVDYATSDGTGLAGQDYVTTTGTLSWADGERGDKTFTVTLPSTATVGRTFTVFLSNLTTTATGTHTLGINNAVITLTDQPLTTTTSPVDNYLGFAARNFNATVKEGIATVTVNRDGTLGALSIDYITNNGSALSGTDYQFTKGTLSWAEGERGDKTFTVPLSSTATVGRVFNLLLSNLQIPTSQGRNTVFNIDTATVTITDTDVVTPPTTSITDPQQVDNFISFVSRNFTATRKAGEATITVNRDGTKGILLVNYTTAGGSAIENQDYQPVVSTLSWADGERGDKTFTVKLFDTATVGSNLTVKLTGVTAINALTPINSSLTIDTASVLITDADPPIVGATPEIVENVAHFVTHGYTALKSQGSATMTVYRVSSLGTVSVNYATQDGTAIVDQDYQIADGTLTWAEGDNSQKTFTVTLLPTATGGHSLSLLLLTAPLPDGTGGGKLLDTAVLSIVDDTQPPTDTGGETTTPPPPTTDGETFQPSTGLGSGTLPAEETSGQQLVPETIENVWDAGGQIYYQPVVVESSDGSLSDAIFAGDVENHGLIGNSTLLPGATLTGGDLTGTMNNQGTITDVNFLGTSLNGGTLAGNITNSSKIGGALTNVTLDSGTTLQGGKLGGTVVAAPDSLIKDVTLLPGTSITGGTLGGSITGDPNSPATITNATITPGTQLANVILLPPVVVPEDVVLGPGVVLPDPSNTLPNQMETLNAEILSQLSPEILSTLTPEQLQEIPPEAFSELSAEQLAALTPEVLAVLSPEQLAEIPPEAFAELAPEQLAAISPEAMAAMTEEQLAIIPPPTMAAMTAPQMAALNRDALAGMTPAQFFFLPPTSVSGLTAQNMGGLSTAVMSQFTRVHVAALNPQEFQAQTAPDMGKFFNNFDPTLIGVENVAHLVPSTWTLNATTGALTPPAGTQLVFKEFTGEGNSLSSVAVVLPSGLPDLKTNFGVSGQGDKSIEEELNLTLDMVDLSQFMMSQDEQGILQIRGTGDYEGVNFSFVPDSNDMIQVDEEVPVGLKVEEGGFYTMTTLDSKQFKVTPSTKDPAGLSDVLEGGAVILGKRGDTFMEIPDGMRAPGEAREVAMFDPLIEPASDEFCEEIAGKMVCDFENAPAAQQPGLRSIPANGARTRQVPGKKIVYADGTSQTIHPTFLSPDTVDEISSGLDGVERVTFNANGSFVVVHKGKKYLVTPNFGTKSRPLSPEEEIEPSLALTGGDHITYTITLDRPATATGTRQTRAGEAREVLEMDSLIEPVADGCEEIKGEIICDGDTGDSGTRLPEATVP